jgi:hypothetical protein
MIRFPLFPSGPGKPALRWFHVKQFATGPTNASGTSQRSGNVLAGACRPAWLGRRGHGLAHAGEHIGDGALGDGETEQAVADLGQPLVADHLAAVQVRDDRRDVGTERRALGHVGGSACRHALAAARAGGAE